MSETAHKHPTSRTLDLLRETLEAMIDDWRNTGYCSQSDKALIVALSEKIDPTERARVIGEFEHDLLSAGRKGTPVFDNVIDLLKINKNWTSAKFRRELEKKGVHFEYKQLMNCINYLVKTGRLNRISRGHYVVSGIGIVSTDQLAAHDDQSKGSGNEM